MRARARTIVGLTALLMSLSGCALFLVGAGVAGGYAISKDSVRNVFDLSGSQLYDKSLAVAKELGAVTLEDHVHRLIKANVEGVNITISIKQLTKRTVELRVQGRNRWLMPKVDVAQAVYSKIIEGL